MNNRNDFVINRDAFLYNTSLTEMHSGTRGETIGTGRTVGRNRVDGLAGMNLDGLDGDGGVISPFSYY